MRDLINNQLKSEVLGTKLNEYQLNLYKKIDLILWGKWDPIGVNDCEDARDEYHSYLPQVFSMKIRNVEKAEIAKYLYEIETKYMGVVGNLKHCEEIAEEVVSL